MFKSADPKDVPTMHWFAKFTLTAPLWQVVGALWSSMFVVSFLLTFGRPDFSFLGLVLVQIVVVAIATYPLLDLRNMLALSIESRKKREEEKST